MLHFAWKYLFPDGKVDLFIYFQCVRKNLIMFFLISALYVSINIMCCLKYVKYHFSWVCFNDRENPDTFWKKVIFHDIKD